MNEFGLETEHEVILRDLVEARRNVPPAQREHFIYVPYPEYKQGVIQHPGLPSGQQIVNSALFDALLYTPFIRHYGHSGESTLFDITPEGLAHYEETVREQETPLQRVEERARRWLLRPDFQRTHERSYSKWSEAEALLWKAESDQDASKIGLLCVEALTFFVDELVEAHKPVGVTADRKRTKDRLSAVVKKLKPDLGDTESKWVDSLFDYSSTVTALAQRVKHAGNKQGQSIIWSDARRAVFQTLNLMYEIDDLLS